MKKLSLLLCFIVATSVQAQNYLVVTEDVPPLQIYKKGTLTGGISAELVSAIFKQAKLSADMEVYPWPRAYNMALTQKDTFIFSIIKSPERQDKFLWIANLYTLNANITKLKSSTDIKIDAPEDINNYKLGVSRGDYGEGYLKSLGLKEGVNLDLTLKHGNLWRLLYSKRVDAIFTNQVTAKSEIEKAGLDPSKASIAYKIKGLDSDIYLAANKLTDPKVIKQLQLAFKEIKTNGVYQKIIDKWQKQILLN